MPGTFVKPKAYNRHFAINIGTSETPKYAEFCRGVTSRGNSISENTEDYQTMCGRGTAETEVIGQTISRTYSGFRVLGDEAQDFILFDKLYEFEGREVEYLDWYDNMPAGLVTKYGNGAKGTATITISDDGSGDATARETVGWGLALNGKPTRGNVTASDTDPKTYAFTALAGGEGGA